MKITCHGCKKEYDDSERVFASTKENLIQISVCPFCSSDLFFRPEYTAPRRQYRTADTDQVTTKVIVTPTLRLLKPLTEKRERNENDS